jgi:hypothetical protein
LVEAQRETEQCFLSENASQEVCRFIWVAWIARFPLHDSRGFLVSVIIRFSSVSMSYSVHICFLFSYLFPDFLYRFCSRRINIETNVALHFHPYVMRVIMRSCTRPNYVHVGAFSHSNAVHVHSTPPDFQRSG